MLFLLSFPILAPLLLGSDASAQNPYGGHHLMHGNMAPGLAAETARLSRPAELTFHVQPVRIMVPDGVVIETGVGASQQEAFSEQVTVGMSIGPVYRFKVSQIPLNFEHELYPSIEVLDKLSPPPGLEAKFPIEIVIEQDDLERAIDGQLVTKVIYLENPEMALPHRHRAGTQPVMDIGGSEDPLRVSQRMGRPMAILRIGSRVPTMDESDLGFGFHSPAPTVIDETQVLQDFVRDWDGLETLVPGQVLTEGDSEFEFSVPPVPKRHLPPIVPGEVQQMPVR